MGFILNFETSVLLKLVSGFQHMALSRLMSVWYEVSLRILLSMKKCILVLCFYIFD